MKGYQTTDLVEAFEACVMAETLRLRGEDADVGRVDAFTQATDGSVLACWPSPALRRRRRRRFVRSRQPLSTARRRYGRVLAYTPGT
jgi:hypothetical protein